MQGRGTSLHGSEDFDDPALPSVMTGLIYARSSLISQVPDSTLYTHAPLSDPGWPGDTTASECRRVLPSACLEGVGFPRLYSISGLNDAACVLATTVLHGAPHGLPRRVRYRPAGGRWPGGTCTHWMRITNFSEACPRIPTFQTSPGTRRVGGRIAPSVPPQIRTYRTTVSGSSSTTIRSPSSCRYVVRVW